jgi:hypothetical protein
LARLDAFAAGVLLGLSAITPAFAATFEPALAPREWLLMGSAVLLAVGLAIRLMRRRGTPDVGPEMPTEMPDLRWWRNP